ncbi:MAG: hypothetical protein IJN92_11585 [Lachnospiraceae bacterium]|nr:hypothetical protein [Lachnospiraceae bacterium]
MLSAYAVYKYEMQKLLKSRKWLTPLIFLAMYLGFSYSVGPLEIVSSLGLCSLVAFIGVLVVIFMCEDNRCQTMDQTIFIRLSNKKTYYLGRVLMVVAVSFIAALIGILVPIFQCIINGPGFFTTPFTIGYGISGFYLFFISGFSGGMVALLLNGRLIPKKEASISICILTALLTIVKGGLHDKYPITRFLSWILPPLYDLSAAYSHIEVSLWKETWIYFLWMTAYVFIQVVFYVWIMDKKRFE